MTQLVDHTIAFVWFCEKLSGCLPKLLYNFAFPIAVNGRSPCTTSSTRFDVVSVLDFRHANMYVVFYCFNFPFPNDKLNIYSYDYAYFSSVYLLYLGEVSVLWFILNWVCFLIVEVICFFVYVVYYWVYHIHWIPILYKTYVLQIFSSSWWLVFLFF